jgi:hypothetical protein
MWFLGFEGQPWQGGQHKKLFQIFLIIIIINCAMLDRSIPVREALVHSIPISEVKDMKNDVLRASKAFFSTKNFEPCLEAQF